MSAKKNFDLISLLFLPLTIMFWLVNPIGAFKDMKKLRLIACILIVGATMYLLMPKVFSLNPLETIGKTIKLVRNYQ